MNIASKLSIQTDLKRQSSVQEQNGLGLLYLEDFDQELDPIFICQELKPYLNGVF